MRLKALAPGLRDSRIYKEGSVNSDRAWATSVIFLRHGGTYRRGYRCKFNVQYDVIDVSLTARFDEK